MRTARRQWAGSDYDRGEYRRAVMRQVQQALDEALDRAESDELGIPEPEEFARAITDIVIGPYEHNALAERVGPFWSSAKVRNELGVRTRQALDSRIASGSLLAVRTADGRLLFPISQFERRGGRVVVRDGLRPLLSTMRDQDGWSVALLIVTPAPELGGQTPLAWARSGGDPERLAHLAKQVRLEWLA